MLEYCKINTVFKRDMNNKGRIIEGDYSLPAFEYLKDNRWVFTEKVDGMNIRVLYNDEVGVQFGGRTSTAMIPAFLYNKLFETFTPDKLKSVFSDGEFVLFGEGYGAKIQKGGGNYNPNGVDFVLFDVWAGMWLERTNVEDIAAKLGIGVVPIVGGGTLSDAVEMVRSPMNSAWGNFQSEGLVMRPATELFTRRGERVIAKIKHRDFK